ncbi:MAG: DUF488 family protein [Candidatus Hadarchaeales archaeon]
MMKIYTIGHSTRKMKDFLNILKHFQIELVIDVRRWPASKKFPRFNKKNLQARLRKADIRYIHFPELGGYRKEGYAVFSQTKEFENAVKLLLEIIDDNVAALLCAEMLWFRCHRRYIAERLVKLGYSVTHIFDEKRTQEHKLIKPRNSPRKKNHS